MRRNADSDFSVYFVIELESLSHIILVLATACGPRVLLLSVKERSLYERGNESCSADQCNL